MVPVNLSAPDTAPKGAPDASGSRAARDAQLRESARAMEASFLAEMLKSAGLGKPRTSFGGGAGEDQFASLLVSEQAKGLVRAGGIGLAEALFEALKERDRGVL